MRKYKLLQGPSLILLIGSLASAQQPRPQPPPQMPGGGGDVFRDEIIANERARLDALKSGNPAALADSISDDAIFVDQQGRATKPEVAKNYAALQLKDYTVADLRFVPVSADGGLVSYTLDATGTRNGSDFTRRLYVSSVWVRSGRQWVCVFNQQTPAR
jgi:ketosteroid isomerase-like protein